LDDSGETVFDDELGEYDSIWLIIGDECLNEFIREEDVLLLKVIAATIDHWLFLIRNKQRILKYWKGKIRNLYLIRHWITMYK
jgi:hypothetical protein